MRFLAPFFCSSADDIGELKAKSFQVALIDRERDGIYLSKENA